jgi:hypothetical protein
LTTNRDQRGPFFSCPLQLSSRPPDVPLGKLALARRLWLQPGPSIPLELSRRARFRERFLSGYPLLWLEDPTSEILLPFWVAHDWFPLMAALKSDTSPSELPFDMASALWRAGALVEPTEERKRAECKQNALHDAKACFASLGYANIGGLVHPAHLTELRAYYRLLIRTQTEIGDAQCARRYGIHNESLARFFHHQFARVIEQVVGEPVLPSYCYFAGYCEGAVLARHTDRAQCEFSVTLLIDYAPLQEASSQWPLWLETRKGQLAVCQAAGDALIYRGRELPHWRTALPGGNRSYSLLFHYVPANFTGPLH